jgi:nitroreductase
MTAKQIDLSLLTQHQSFAASELTSPAPTAEELGQILQAAMSAPDHGNLQPFRFLIIDGDARLELSAVFEEAATARGLDAAGIAKQKNKPLRAPLIIVVIATLSANPKIPEIEQLLSAGCAAQHIQLACHQAGFGSIWLTGDNAYDLSVHAALGLDLNERIIGFVYVGTPPPNAPPRPRMDATSITTHWLKKYKQDFAI